MQASKIDSTLVKITRRNKTLRKLKKKKKKKLCCDHQKTRGR